VVADGQECEEMRIRKSRIDKKDTMIRARAKCVCVETQGNCGEIWFTVVICVSNCHLHIRINSKSEKPE